MSKRINPIQKALYKKSRKQGKSKEQSLLDAGYSPVTARVQNKNLRVDKVGDAEIAQELKAKDITVDWVVEQLTLEITAPDAKASDRIRVKELLGKYINMFKDAQPSQTFVFAGDIVKDLPPLSVEQVKQAIDVTPDIPSTCATDP